MEFINNPDRLIWNKLIERPILNNENLLKIIQPIFDRIQKNKDKALIEITSEIDKIKLENIQVLEHEFKEALNLVDDQTKQAIDVAYNNIKKFHLAQINEKQIIETTQGVKCWRISKPVEKVGLYIPGGTAPLFSTILMLGIPAKIAGCKEIIICTPPNNQAKINPIILYVANKIGINKVFKIGGSQAIAAMTFGTESVPKVYKIFGPGNQFVTKAKELALNYKVAIDMPAGPSEVLIIADNSAIPDFIAADLLAQAEHGKDSQVILVSTSKQIINQTKICIENQLQNLSRKDILEESLQKSRFILFDNVNECFDFSNEYAPEHLILAIENAENYEDKIINAGSVFIGNYSCESAGDYASGTNHTLPTNGFAKNYSGVSLDSFVKKITFQKLTKEGLKNIGNTIEIMAEKEGLDAHKNAVTLRLKNINI